MSTPVTMDELKEILRKHAAWLAGEEAGSRADLRGANLSHANLSDANLSYADLTDANLTRANLYGADLTRANLYGANLSCANLTGATLRGANLTRANLYGANLSHANLSDADLRGANLGGATLSHANLYGADLTCANLTDATLSGANLILIGQDIRGYLFWAYKNKSDVVVIRAGCRTIIGITAARAHWENRHQEDKILHADCLSMIDRCERMAAVRGWKLEPTND